MNSKVQNCINPVCGGDPLQFHMTAKNGAINFPYTPATSSRYKQHGKPTDLSQCRVDVHRQGDQGFSIYVFDSTGTEKGRGFMSAFANTASKIITGLPATLQFDKFGPFAASGAGMGFQYNSNPPFNWFGTTTGSSLQYQPDGKYCSVVTSGTVQDLKCYFPCPE